MTYKHLPNFPLHLLAFVYFLGLFFNLFDSFQTIFGFFMHFLSSFEPSLLLFNYFQFSSLFRDFSHYFLNLILNSLLTVSVSFWILFALFSVSFPSFFECFMDFWTLFDSFSTVLNPFHYLWTLFQDFLKLFLRFLDCFPILLEHSSNFRAIKRENPKTVQNEMGTKKKYKNM